MTMPENPCPHLDFIGDMDVTRLQDSEGEDGVTIAYTVSITVKCSECDEPFVWMGHYPIGDLPGDPAISVDRRELRAPIRPASAPENYGLGRAGFYLRDHTT